MALVSELLSPELRAVGSVLSQEGVIPFRDRAKRGAPGVLETRKSALRVSPDVHVPRPVHRNGLRDRGELGPELRRPLLGPVGVVDTHEGVAPEVLGRVPRKLADRGAREIDVPRAIHRDGCDAVVVFGAELARP